MMHALVQLHLFQRLRKTRRQPRAKVLIEECHRPDVVVPSHRSAYAHLLVRFDGPDIPSAESLERLPPYALGRAVPRVDAHAELTDLLGSRLLLGSPAPRQSSTEQPP